MRVFPELCHSAKWRNSLNAVAFGLPGMLLLGVNEAAADNRGGVGSAAHNGGHLLIGGFALQAEREQLRDGLGEQL